jgi:hypothetical protein
MNAIIQEYPLTIVDVSNLGHPERQNITPTDFVSPFATMLCPWNKTGPLAICTGLDIRHQVTDSVSTLLFYALAASHLHTPRDYLHDLFATPLYHFTH